MRVKVCGITRLEDALFAADAGVWAVGFIFVPGTPRYISPECAGHIIAEMPETVEKISVFANSSVDEVVNIAKMAGITKIQLHGDEQPEFCSEIREKTSLDVIKAFRVSRESDLKAVREYKGKIAYMLLDTYSEKQLGGTGKTFDREIAKQAKKCDIPLIVAGGLTPDNLKQIYNEIKPYALDLSSGVEESPGIKSKKKLLELKNLIKTSSE